MGCGGTDIPDEPKITCDIEIGDGLGGVVHRGRIGIERRGRSSIDFPKAQYSIELRTETEAEQPVGLFGMGRESDSDTDVFTLMDLDSAVDFVLLQELARGNDANFLSMYVWKGVDGTLHFTSWDLDLSLGQPLYGDSTLTTGWIAYRPRLIQALANDARFQARLVARWSELRQTAFSAEAIEARTQRYLATIGDRIDENFARWPIEDIQFLDNQLPPRSSFEEELEVVRGWIDGRLTWVDAHIGEYPAGN